MADFLAGLLQGLNPLIQQAIKTRVQQAQKRI